MNNLQPYPEKGQWDEFLLLSNYVNWLEVNDEFVVESDITVCDEWQTFLKQYDCVSEVMRDLNKGLGPEMDFSYEPGEHRNTFRAKMHDVRVAVSGGPHPTYVFNGKRFSRREITKTVQLLRAFWDKYSHMLEDARAAKMKEAV